VASLERRLRQLETHAATVGREDEEAVYREVMRRLTDEELDAYEEALRRDKQHKNHHHATDCAKNTPLWLLRRWRW